MNSDSGEFKLHFLDYWRVLRVRLPLIIFVFLLVVITAAVITRLMPREYESTATLQIKQFDVTMTVFDQQSQSSAASMGALFIATQFKILQEKEMLYPVIDALGLDKKWNTTHEGAYWIMRGNMTAQEVRGTELIQITVTDADPREAAEIANAIALQYQRKRIDDQQEWVERSLSQLKEEVAKQSRKVDDLRLTMNNIRTEQHIDDLDPDTIEEASSPENDVLRNVENEVSTEKLHVASLKAKYDQISQMTDEQIMRSISSLEIQDTTIAQVLPEYEQTASDEAKLLNSGLGVNHPAVKSLRAQEVVMENQLKAQIAVLRKTLLDNFNIAQDGLKGLQGKLDEARNDLTTTKIKSASYYEAKNNYIQAKHILEAAQAKLSTETLEKTMPMNPVTIWEKGEPASAPSHPNVVLNIILGALVGLFAGVGLAFFIEYLDTSVKTMEDVETYLKVPVLAVIPRHISVLLNSTPDDPDAEAYRIMRTNIEFNRKNPDANTITVVSGGVGEGKSTTVANLAYTFACGGYSTLIVDADLRRPAQHRIFEVDNEVGLTDYLTNNIHLEEVVTPTKIDNLYLLTSGRLPEDAVGILNSQRMVDFVEDVKRRFDIVFFDSPPILGLSDASVLASAVDLTIIVVQHRRFPRAMLLRVKQAVVNVGGNILGVVLNNVDVRHDQHYQYYTNYYNYYSPKAAKEKNKGKKSEKSVSQHAETPESDDSY